MFSTGVLIALSSGQDSFIYKTEPIQSALHSHKKGAGGDKGIRSFLCSLPAAPKEKSENRIISSQAFINVCTIFLSLQNLIKSCFSFLLYTFLSSYPWTQDRQQL